MEVRDLTIGFARRDATYKRGDLVFRDLDRLKQIAATGGRIQIIYAGKAHPHDQGGRK
jgi:glycogen phosphorylase